MRKLVICFLGMLTFSLAANVAIFKFDTPEQEKRFQRLVAELRCQTCQNQNLADSNSMVAEDLKQIVYEKVVAGESDQQILTFMKQRYGEFILYEPEMSQSNMMLWAGPFIFLVLTLGGFLMWYKNNKVEELDE